MHLYILKCINHLSVEMAIKAQNSIKTNTLNDMERVLPQSWQCRNERNGIFGKHDFSVIGKFNVHKMLRVLLCALVHVQEPFQGALKHTGGRRMFFERVWGGNSGTKPPLVTSACPGQEQKHSKGTFLLAGPISCQAFPVFCKLLCRRFLSRWLGRVTDRGSKVSKTFTGLY